MLEIKLLGQFDVRRDGRPVDLSSRPAQSLLACLIVKRGVPQRRERLAGLLWPDATEANARAYLRQALWRVRRALQGEEEAGAGELLFLLADDLTITFDPHAACQIDVAELERDVAPDGPPDELLDAVAVYQGELLPGFYDEWVAPERERLQTVFESKMGLLLERLVAGRRWADVLVWGERWIALGYVPEPAYRALMVAHAGLGDRSSVAAAYQRCVEALRRELDVEPAPPTQALYEQLSRGGRDEMPADSPWRVLQAGRRPTPAGNLPRPLTSFVGRERETAEVTRLLTESPARLVTLTGSGGCGKTRLALQVGQALQPHYPQGVWLVELAPLADPALVPQAVAAVLELREEPGCVLLTVITRYLRARRALLILDNCEHLIDASAHLAEVLLQACPDLRILTSSREALGIAGETAFRVPSLSTPDLRQVSPPDVLLQHDAVRLFVERAAVVLPGFDVTPENAAALAQVCCRLDGIPLAIELAAARVQVLTVEQIAARLSGTFRLLTGGSRTALPRQQTLQATMDWSYNLLSAPERALLRRLSVFAGGWTLEAAEAVCVDPDGPGDMEGTIDPPDVLDLLTQLINKSLVAAERAPGVEARYRLLETVRQYAREKLSASGDGEHAWDRHLAYFLALAEWAAPELRGPDQRAWLDRLEAEVGNLRAALEWSLEGRVEPGLRLGIALRNFCIARGYMGQMSEKLLQLLNAPEARARPLVYASALDVAANLLMWQSDFVRARLLSEQSLALFRELGDRAGEACGLRTLGNLACLQDDYTLGRALVLESLALYRALGDRCHVADTLSDLGSLADCRDYGRAAAYLEESMAIYRERGDPGGVAYALDSLGVLAVRQGDFPRARSWLEESLAMQRPLGGSGAAIVLSHLGELALHEGDFARACSCYCESLALGEQAGHRLLTVWGNTNLGYVALRMGNEEQARATFEQAQQLFRAAGSQIGVVYALEGLASLAAQQGRVERAVRLFAWADATREAIGDPRPPVEQAGVEQVLEQARSQIDPVAWPALCAEGRALTMDQAVTYALE